jgi:predicted enzyme related to lactoylglutathione lyase
VISGEGAVVLDVADRERAEAFGKTATRLEFVQDSAAGGERWLEVRSPAEAAIRVLGPTKAGPGDRSAVPAAPPASNLMFRCDDLAATYAARGVGVPQPPVRPGLGWRSLFTATEGNRFALTPTGQGGRTAPLASWGIGGLTARRPCGAPGWPREGG